MALQVDTLVLRRPGTRFSKRDKMILFVMLLGLIVTAVWMLSALPMKPAENPGARTKGLLDFLGHFGFEALGVIAAAWYMVRVVRHERLTLDRGGIRYQSPLAGPFAGLQPSWSHSWAQIRSAEITLPWMANPNLLSIVLDVVTAKRRIVGQWVPLDGPPQDLIPLSLRRPGADEVLRRVHQSPLVEYMQRMGVKVEVNAKARGGFVLESNRAALSVTVAVVALLLYAVADFAFNTESYAEKPQLQVFILGGIAVFVASAALLRLARVPGAESVGLGFLLGVAVGVASYPGALRLNQLTDRHGLQAHEYRMKEVAVWEPRDAALPTLRFSDFLEYWDQFKPGAQREFLLRRGALGFFQVEMAPVREEMKAYYRKNP
jgi:hypothetical protein